MKPCATLARFALGFRRNGGGKKRECIRSSLVRTGGAPDSRTRTRTRVYRANQSIRSATRNLPVAKKQPLEFPDIFRSAGEREGEAD